MWVQSAIIPRNTPLPYGGKLKNEAVLARESVLTPDVMVASQDEVFLGGRSKAPIEMPPSDPFPSQSVSTTH